MRIILPIVPITLFRISYEFYSLLVSVFIGVVAALVIFLYEFFVHKKLSYLSLATISIMGVFCLIDAMSSATEWVMVGASIVALVYSGVFFIAYMDYSSELTALMRIPVADFPKHIQEKTFRNSTIFFLLLAILNELVWRTQLESIWVEFRTFFILPSILFFGAIQIIYYSIHVNRNTDDKK